MTNLYSVTINQNNIRNIIKKESNSLLKQILIQDNFLIVKGAFNTVTKDKVQKSLFVDCDDSFERLIKPIILSAAMEGEVISPFSGDLSLIFLLKLLSGYIKKDINTGSQFLENIKTASNKSRRNFSFNNLNKIIVNITESVHVKKVINNAILMAGSENKIFVESDVSEDTTIELVNGYYFKRPISDESLCFFGANRNWERKNTKIVIIDGDIISVSDIHFLLESLSETKRPCVLIARSFAPDVLNTLHANFRRGTLDIIPVDIPFEQDTANILVDIAAACNTDIVSPLKGDLISKSCNKELKEVKSIKITSAGLTVVNPVSDKRCHALLLNLRNRIKNEKHFEIKEILSRRVVSLSGSKVIIKVGKNVNRDYPAAVEDMDKILRTVKSVTKHGIITNKSIISEIEKTENMSIEMRLLLDSLRAFPLDKIFPSASIFIAAKKGLSTFDIIKNTSCGLLIGNI